MSGDFHLHTGQIFQKDVFENYIIFVDVDKIVKCMLVIFYTLIV